MSPTVPRGARLGPGGQAAFLEATQNFQPTNMLRRDSQVWRPSTGDLSFRQDSGVFSPVGDREDSSLWDVGENAIGTKKMPQALVDNSAGDLGLSPVETLEEDPKKRQIKNAGGSGVGTQS